MTPIKRWKLASATLAAGVAYLWLHDRQPDRIEHAGHSRAAIDRPVWIDTRHANVSTDELVRRLLTTRNIAELRQLAQKLGVVGDDAAIDAVMPLLADKRPEVAPAIVAAFGEIGTEHAADILLEHVADHRDDVRAAVIDALGATHQARVEPVLVEIAHRSNDDVRTNAISALGALGTDTAVETLFELADSGAAETSLLAIGALAETSNPAATTALVRLIDAPNLAVAAHAIESLTVVDATAMAHLEAIVRGGQAELVDAALHALAHAGPPALPTLRDIALHGNRDFRAAAIGALATIPGAETFATLREIVEHGDAVSADAAAGALATLDTPEARALLIAIAHSDRAAITHAAHHLLELEGADVDRALLDLARNDSDGRDEL